MSGKPETQMGSQRTRHWRDPSTAINHDSWSTEAINCQNLGTAYHSSPDLSQPFPEHLPWATQWDTLDDVTFGVSSHKAFFHKLKKGLMKRFSSAASSSILYFLKVTIY